MNQLTGKLSDRHKGIVDRASAVTASPVTLESLYELAQEVLAKVVALHEGRAVRLLRPCSAAAPGTQPFDFYDAVRAYEALLIRDALIQCNGRQRDAAQLLGLKYTTLNSKIKSHNICFKEVLNSRRT